VQEQFRTGYQGERIQNKDNGHLRAHSCRGLNIGKGGK